MFMEPVWDDFCFVTWHIMDVAIITWVNCNYKAMHVVNNIQMDCGIQMMFDRY